MTRIGTILPGQKLDPWFPHMQEYLPDGADVIIVREVPPTIWAVQSLDDWHSKSNEVWYVHKNNIQLKGFQA